MNLHIQYLTNEQGVKTAVQIPLEEWLQFYKEYTSLKQYAAFKQGLREAFQEVREIECGEKTGLTLEEFLNAC